MKGPFSEVCSSGLVRIVEVSGRKLKVELGVGGETHRAFLKRSEVRPVQAPEDPEPYMWASVKDAIRRRSGADIQVEVWWGERFDRTLPDEALLLLYEEHRPIAEALEGEIAAEIERVEPRFRTRFFGLDPKEKRRRWKEERMTWLEGETARSRIEARYQGVENLDELRRRGRYLLRRAERAARVERRAAEPLGIEDPRVAPRVSAPEIEAEIDAAPDALGPYLVYADLLQSGGDPRGELIALQAGGDPDRPDVKAAQRRLLDAHAPYFLGALAEYPREVELTWRCGFVESARIVVAGDGADLLRTLLALPSARWLRGLVLCEVYESEDLECALEVLAERRPPHLARLQIGARDGDDVEEVDVGDLSPAAEAFRGLEELVISADRAELPDVALPGLRRLTVETRALSAASLGTICRHAWPALEQLDLWLGASSAGASIQALDLAALLSGKATPVLKTLGLQNAEIADDLAGQLLGAKLVKRLEALDLSMGTMTDEGAETLCFGAKVFARLRLLDVRRNFLSPRGRKQLSKLGPVVLSRPQRTAEDEGFGELVRRVVVDDDLPL